jgi:hypothetical protein
MNEKKVLKSGPISSVRWTNRAIGDVPFGLSANDLAYRLMISLALQFCPENFAGVIIIDAISVDIGSDPARG